MQSLTIKPLSLKASQHRLLTKAKSMNTPSTPEQPRTWAEVHAEIMPRVKAAEIANGETPRPSRPNTVDDSRLPGFIRRRNNLRGRDRRTGRHY